MRVSLFKIITFIELTPFHEWKGMERGKCRCSYRKLFHNHVDLTLLASVEATGSFIPVGNSDVLLAAVCMSPGHARNSAHITELLNIRYKLLVAGNLNARHQF
jgi:hypothetical protein